MTGTVSLDPSAPPAGTPGAGNAAQAAFARLREYLRSQILGQETLVGRLLVALLADGHLLVEGPPGLAKTRAIKALAHAVEADFQRVQFTPDLLPADLTGSEIYRPEEGSFRFQRGPLFHNLILADEINRAPAKVQAALLEAMAERQISVGAASYALPPLFLVMATQNPIEQEGTYPLPEAQLDRFLLQVDMTYPDQAAERTMLLATTGAEAATPRRMLSPEQLLAAQALIRRVPVGESVVAAILDLVRGGRPETASDEQVRRHVAWGPGPRAAQALMLACRARALLDGRLAPSLDDIVALAPAVLRHRMALTFAARADGVTLSAVIARLVEALG